MKHLNAFFGDTLLTALGPLPIDRCKPERVQAAAPATVNREIALLKPLFNMAENWGMYRGRNPVKGVKFLSENNLQCRSLTEEEEARLIQHCSPYLQDMVTFAMILACGSATCSISNGRDPVSRAKNAANS